MSVSRTLLVLGVLAAIMLVRCEKPIGIPNQVRMAATTYYATPPYAESATGHIDHFDNPPRGVPAYSRDIPTIKWGVDEDPYGENPRANAFSVFEIPYIENAESEIWPCTLHYYLRAQSGDPDYRLVVTELSSDPRTTSDALLFWDAWYGDSIAGDITHTSTGWYKIPLSLAACAAITSISNNFGGGDYYTGWITPDTVDWGFCLVYGATENASPYISITTYP